MCRAHCVLLATVLLAPFVQSQGSDDCSTPTPIFGEGAFAFDNSSATMGPTGQNEALCTGFGGMTAVDHDVWFEWTAGCSGVATLETCIGTLVDTKVAVYPGSGCPSDGAALDCNDDACGTNLFQSRISWVASIGSTYTIQLGTFPTGNGGQGLFSIDSEPCTDIATPLCFGDGTGTPCPCGNDGDQWEGCENGTGSGAELEESGSVSVSADDLTFTSRNLPPGQPGLFFQGDNEVNQGDGVPFGDGLRCCGQHVVRLEVVTSNIAGEAGSTVAIATEGGVAAGDRRCYQYWYRDPQTSPCGVAFNLSHALRVDWLP